MEKKQYFAKLFCKNYKKYLAIAKVFTSLAVTHLNEFKGSDYLFKPLYNIILFCVFSGPWPRSRPTLIAYSQTFRKKKLTQKWFNKDSLIRYEFLAS